MSKQAAAKVCFITRRYLVKATGAIVSVVRNGGGNEYIVTKHNGRCSCDCPSRVECYHIKHVEVIEAARTTITVGGQQVSGATPAHAVRKALQLVQPVTVVQEPVQVEAYHDDGACCTCYRVNGNHVTRITDGSPFCSSCRRSDCEHVNLVLAHHPEWPKCEDWRFEQVQMVASKAPEKKQDAPHKAPTTGQMESAPLTKNVGFSLLKEERNKMTTQPANETPAQAFAKRLIAVDTQQNLALLERKLDGIEKDFSQEQLETMIQGATKRFKAMERKGKKANIWEELQSSLDRGYSEKQAKPIPTSFSGSEDLW